MQQILDETSAILALDPASMRELEKRRRPIRQSSFPLRQSSLAIHDQEHQAICPTEKGDVELYVREENLETMVTLKNEEAAKFAAELAELYLLQSRVLQKVGEFCGWNNMVVSEDKRAISGTVKVSKN